MNTIPWETISGQQKDCRHVPEAIATLQSVDPSVRKAAYWKLDNHVVVQGGLYEGAFYVVPFLLQVCYAESPTGKSEALNLLIEIAGGAAGFDKSVSFRTIEQPFRYFVPNQNGGIPLAVACRFAIASSLNRIISCIAEVDADVRTMTRDLLLLFPEYAFAIAEKLRRIADSHELNDQMKKDLYKLINGLRA
jgi:hypothetical protein